MPSNMVLRLLNSGFSLSYFAFGLAAGWRVLSSTVNPAGGLVVAGLAVALAIGHLMLKGWAIRSSAAIASFVALLMIPYLVGGFERELLPQFSTRFLYFSVVALVAGFTLLNHWIYIRSVQTQNNEKH